jgi:hypothetical protein
MMMMIMEKRFAFIDNGDILGAAELYKRLKSTIRYA